MMPSTLRLHIYFFLEVLMSTNRDLKILFGHMADFCIKWGFVSKILWKIVKNDELSVAIKNDAFHLQGPVLAYLNGVNVYERESKTFVWAYYWIFCIWTSTFSFDLTES